VKFLRLLSKTKNPETPAKPKAQPKPRSKKNRFKVTNELLEAIEDARIFTTVNKKEKSWLKKGTVVTVSAGTVCDPYSAIRSGPNFFSIGSYSYSRSCFPATVNVGRYCAIAQRVQVMGLDHPMERLSMVGFDYSQRKIFEAARKDFGTAPDVHRVPNRGIRSLNIGNDVWIGDDVLLGRNIKVGNGAVIAARSIVTKDVPDYAIVAGSPAKVKRYRFPDETVERLMRSRWWKYSFTDFAGMDTTKVPEFLDHFEQAVADGQIQPWQPNQLPLLEMFSTSAEKLG
jgi:acetyltransferase-like isoleucine patch superfamily enzyme